MLFDALVFHEVLSNGHATVLPPARAGKGKRQSFLRSSWIAIRNDINYKPVFDLAIDILDALPASPDTERMLDRLSVAAGEAVGSGILLKHDFMGRIYHKLLLSTTGHYYATYYTSLPAAWLLTGLLIREPHPLWDFGDLQFFDDFRVIDPACGSGTLLSASYAAIRDQHIKYSFGEIDLNLLHEVLLSTSIHGWDVLDFAAHLSLTSLALHSDTVHAEQSNIYRMPLGAKKGGSVQLGSLEYLRKTMELKGIALSDPVEELELGGRTEVELTRSKYDLVVMNPPFSRTAKPNLNFGYSEGETRARMRASLSELGRALGLFKAAVAGLTPFFMELGLEMLKDEGRIGLVAPRSILTGVGSRVTRRNFEQQTHIKYIVSNFDPGSRSERVDGWSWSENTDLGEVLLVAQRRSKKKLKKAIDTVYVNVVRKPRNEVEALILSQEILKATQTKDIDLFSGGGEAVSVAGKPSAYIYSVKQCSIEGAWLSPATFATPALNAFVMQTRESKSLGSIQKVLAIVNRELATGRDIAPVKQNFKRHPVKSDGRMISGHQATMNEMMLESTNIHHAKGLRNPASKKMYQNFSATLLLAERPHLKTESLLCFLSPERVLTTAFWELQLKDDVPEDWLVAWFNSTYGIFAYLSTATSSQGDIFKLKKDQLKDMLVPVFDKTLAGKARRLIKKLAHTPFLPYSREFDRAAEQKGPRYQLDQLWSQNLTLPDLDNQTYLALAADPVVSKKALA